MSERYSRLYSLTENLYTNGAPVIISAGALLKDNNTGKILVQLKIRSISNKKIKALTINIIAHDTVGRVICDPIPYQFLDLSISRDESFGQKTAIYMTDDSTRGFDVKIIEVAFEDNSIWNETLNTEWNSLPKLNALLPDKPELLKQYRIDINKNAKNEYLESNGLWLCACGSINTIDEDTCHNCGSKVSLMKNCDYVTLKENCEKRIIREKEEKKDLILKKATDYINNNHYSDALEQLNQIPGWKDADEKVKICNVKMSEIKAADTLRKKKRRKNEIIAAVLILIIIILGIVTKTVFTPLRNYKTAASLMKSEKYDEAVAIFESLDGFKNSKDLLNECLYQKALKLLESDNYEVSIKALDIFSTLGEYQDSAEKVIEAKRQSIYLEAMLAFSGERDCEWAINKLTTIKHYRDSEEKIEELKLEKNYQTAITQLNEYDYIAACKSFETISDYKDSDDKLDECYKIMYEYVLSHRKDPSTICLDYLSFLRSKEYKDSASLIEKIFKIEFKVEDGYLQFCTRFDIREPIKFIIYAGENFHYVEHTANYLDPNKWYVLSLEIISFSAIEAYINGILITRYQP